MFDILYWTYCVLGKDCCVYFRFFKICTYAISIIYKAVLSTIGHRGAGSISGFIIIIIMTRRQLRSVATTLHDDRDPVPSFTPV